MVEKNRGHSLIFRGVMKLSSLPAACESASLFKVTFSEPPEWQRRSTVQRRQRVGWIRNHGASPSKCILIPLKRIYHQYSQPYCIIIIVMFVSPSQTMHYVQGICAPTLPCLCIALSPRMGNPPTLKQKKNYNNSETAQIAWVVRF